MHSRDEEIILRKQLWLEGPYPLENIKDVEHIAKKLNGKVYEQDGALWIETQESLNIAEKIENNPK